jgi:hypothetical protein
VQQWLPQMSARLVDQCDIRALTPPKRVTKPRDEFQPAGTSADNNDTMKISALARHSTLQARAPVSCSAGFHSAANFVIVVILA